jgi:hypothetical protein
MRVYKFTLTQEEILALNRAIDYLPKRSWDEFVQTASPFLQNINAQIQLQDRQPPPTPVGPPTDVPPPPSNGHGANPYALPDA